MGLPIGSAPLGENSSPAGTEKIAVSGSQWMALNTIKTWIKTAFDLLYLPLSNTNFTPTGLTGATAASRYVGATASGAPASGTFAKGDFVVDQTGSIYVCTVAGTPGTWVQIGASSGGGDGWTSNSNTWSYSSADSPTFVISVNADMTALIGVGDRIKLTQTTVKYFIVTAVGAYSAGATLITVYGGTDYTLANAAISSPYYSHAKSPFGFPLSPDKWTVVATNTSDATKNNPTQNVWYGGANAWDSGTASSISAPIGAWRVSFFAGLQVVLSASSPGGRITLSTSNNSESDTDITVPTLAAGNYIFPASRWKIKSFATKTTLYLLSLTVDTGVTYLINKGSQATTTIKLECAYL